MTECTREFKVGDKVVLENEPSLAQIHKTDGRWPIIKWLDDNTESNVRLDFLRHATDEEIAAGRRIDLIVEPNDMGDDTHIENHISPLIERLKVENVVLQAKVDELQKRVDAVKQLIEDYKDPSITSDKSFQHGLLLVADELEQALKGGGE